MPYVPLSNTFRAARDPLLLAGTIALLAGSLAFALTRALQVDELQNLYMARILARGELQQAYAVPAVWLYGPLGWLTKYSDSTRCIFAGGRVLFWLVFWTNLTLLAWTIADDRGRKERLFWLLFAGTLSPLWDYGMEIRHDNLLLTAMLFVAYLARRARRAATAWLVLGGLIPLLQLVAYKSFAYLCPLLFLLLAFPSPSLRMPWKHRTSLLLAGLIGTSLLLAFVYWASGGLSVVLDEARALTAVSGRRMSFSPRLSLSRLPPAVPLLLTLTLLLPMGIGLRAVRGRWFPSGWSGPWPEGAFLFLSLGLLWANPTPFPYNLVFVTGGAALFVGRCIACLRLMEGPHAPPMAAVPTMLRSAGRLVPLVGILIAAQLLPFGRRVAINTDHGNEQQIQVATYVEALTGEDDPVYDAAGLVVSRKTVGPLWYLHSLLLGRMPSVGRSWVTLQLEKDPAPVLLLNYRWRWLQKDDRAWLTARYIALSPQIYVLGAELPAGGGTLQILRPGRYEITGHSAASLSSCKMRTTASGPVSPSPQHPSVLELRPGDLHVQCDPGVRPRVRWLGPHLERIPDAPPVDARTWFVNWY